MWDLDRGREVTSFKGHTGYVYGVAISPDGGLAASGGDDRVVRVWDAATGKELLNLRGHRDEINRVGFSPDGRFVASCGEDRTVRVWDVTGLELAAR